MSAAPHISDKKGGGTRLFIPKYFLFVTFFVGSFIPSCTSHDITVSFGSLFSISLDDDALFVSETAQVNFFYTNRFGVPQPSSHAQWSSSNTEIVQVDAQGKLIAIGSGIATITASIVARNLSKTVNVTVSNLASLKITSQQSSIQASNSLQLEFRFKDVRGEENATQKVMWRTEDSSKLEVNELGYVTALDLGLATITVSTSYLGKEYADAITLHVKPIEPVIKITNAVETINQQDRYQLIHSFTDDTGKLVTEQQVVWESNHPDILDIDHQGNLTVVDNGTARILVSTMFKESSYEDDVIIAVSGVSYTPKISNALEKIVVGKDLQLNYHLIKDHSQEHITPQSVRWSSTKDDILHIDPSSGLLKAIKEGEATIVLTMDYNGTTYFAEETIAVHAVENFRFDITNLPEEPLHFEKNNPYGPLTYTLKGDQGSDLTNKVSVQWESSDSAVANFIGSEPGILELKKPGQVLITARTKYEGEIYTSDSIEINIVMTPTITIKSQLEEGKLNIQEEYQLKYTYTNEHGEQSELDHVTWKSSDPSILKVRPENGIITGIKHGNASITVTTDQDIISPPISIRVIQDPQIEITGNIDEIEVGKTEILKFEYINEDGERVDPKKISVRWKSEDPMVLTVDETSGKIKGNFEGEVAITVETVETEDKSQSKPKIIKVVRAEKESSSGGESQSEEDNTSTVNHDSNSDVDNPDDEENSGSHEDSSMTTPKLEITQIPKEFYIGNAGQLQANYTDEHDQTSENVSAKWTSNDTSVLYVDLNTGYIEARSIGTVTITTQYKGIQKKVVIRVVEPNTNVPDDFLKWHDNEVTVIINPKYLSVAHDYIGEVGILDGTPYRIVDNQSLRRLIQNREKLPLKCTTLVTKMNFLFENRRGIEPIEHWDVSRVTQMISMFEGASSFNQDLKAWDVSHVVDMHAMFKGASSFNQDLKAWDVSRVVDMEAMFSEAASFEGDLSGWEVGNVTTMGEMFQEASSFNGDLTDWDVSRVSDLSGTFQNASSFKGESISGWDVSQATDMSNLFSKAVLFKGDISGWDVSQVVDMEAMFSGATSFNGNLSRWKVENVTNMSYMFYGASFDGNLSRWVVSSVTNMERMFYENTTFDGDLSRWDVSSVTNMEEMFYNASSFDQNISIWSVQNVTNCKLFANYLDSSKQPPFGPCR